MADLDAALKNLSPRQRDLLLRRLAREGGGAEPDRIPRQSRNPEGGGELPASFSQQRLWFLDRLEPGTPLYNIPAAIEAEGRLDVAVLQATLTEIVRRHEALRTTFGNRPSGPVQVVHPAGSVEVGLPVVDLRALPPAVRKAEVARLATAESRQPFDLSRGPLLRALLLRLEEERHWAVLTLHHIVSDGWSMGVLVSEIASLYPALAAGEAPALSELPVQMGDFAAWERERLQGESLEREVAFWRQALAGAPQAIDLPTDFPRPALQTVRGAQAPVRLEPQLVAALREAGRASGQTLFMTILAAFEVLLGRWSGQDRLLVGSPISGRNRPEVQGLIGFFVNTLVLRGDLGGDPLLADFLGRVKETVLAAFAHQDLPFGRLVEELNPERDVSRAPLFQVVFTLQRAAAEALSLPGLTLRPHDLDTGVARFELTLHLAEGAETVAGWIEYNTDLFAADTAERMVGQLTALLAALPGSLERPLSELPLLTEGERRQLLAFNATGRTWAPGIQIHELFEEQAVRTPDKPAVTFGGRTLTYAQLDEAANRLARRLRRLGVGPEVRVGHCLERSADMVVALLAILKAGGAYVPLDPAHPAERVGFILGDSNVALLVTQERLLETLRPEVEVLCMDRDAAEIAAESGAPLDRRTVEDNLAYVLYTSGSTGRPKGVQVPHRSMVNLLRGLAEDRSMVPADVLPAHITLSFDLSGVEMFLPLMVGARMEVLTREEVLDGAGLGQRLHDMGATYIHTPPSLLRLLLAAGWSAKPGMRLVTGGEPLPRNVAETLLAQGGELWTEYGPTEATVIATASTVSSGEERVRIGHPLANTRLYVVDADLALAPVGVAGELLIGGTGVARGYLDRPDLTAEKFVPDPWGEAPGSRLYRTGDRVRWHASGELEFVGRVDFQVKIRGFRLELGEIEAVLQRYPGIAGAVVAAHGEGSSKQLAAYVVAKGEAPSTDELREHVRSLLPDFMVPSSFMVLEALPLTPTGKVDRKALPAPEGTRDAASEKIYVDPSSDLERTIAAIWRGVLQIDRVGADDNFFDLGGHSLLAAQVHTRLGEALGREIALVDLFQYPTVSSLAAYLGGAADTASRVGLERAARRQAAGRLEDAVAIIGMAGRFPGAGSVEAFWRNLTEGVESISFFSDEELLEAGVPEDALADPSYVRARGIVEGADEFDAAFFGYSPREAGMLDPQQRLFLECAWEAFEDAGHEPATFPGDVGVFAGSGMNTYVLNFLADPETLDSVGNFQLMLSNDKDFLAPRVSYKLGLKGPSFAVQSACSTSLVAVHLACQSILAGECDAALAGGVSVRLPQATGYRFHEGAVFSPDGHLRAFDEEAGGLVAGNGVGVVFLRRLSDALRDGDPIRAVIRGSAMNNDGAVRAGFTAPGVEGQAQVVAQALAVARVEPETIGYVEAHGTGTNLGDPIEMAALIQAFGPKVPREAVWIGSGKTNVGHLDTAAGVTGLIKAALVVERGWIPPTLHFQRPNPKLRLPESPFRVVDRLTEWPSGDAPRRAGVSSLGIGGTNAHVIVEEPPAAEPGSAPRSWQLLLLSARTPAALEAAIDRFTAFLRDDPETDFADAAYTLQVGRRSFDQRLALVCRDREDALSVLAGSEKRRLLWSEQETADRPVTFLFSGLGEHYPGMARELYAAEPTFRAELDRCCDLLVQHLDLDLRTLLFPEAPEAAATGTDLRALLGRRERKASELDRTLYAQPAVFAIEYALAHLLMEWGIRPQSLIGYSLGEYTAACIAGVLSLEDALSLVARRARLIDGLPSGAMLAVPLPEEETRELLSEELSIASLNGPSATVASGPEAVIADLEQRLEERGQPGRRLPTTHAFHSRMMEPIQDAFAVMVSGVRLSPPRIPYVSNVTGTWITAEEATDPGYWVRHLCQAVRFADGLAELSEDPMRVLVEVGPGQGLTSLALQAPGELKAIPTVRSSWDVQSDTAFLLIALGKLWLAGVPVDWTGFYAHERRLRVPLPTYPFQRQSYWVKGAPPSGLGQGARPVMALEGSGQEVRATYARPDLRSGYVAPRNRVEETVSRVWAELLGLDRVGIDDNFFDLGGHSLLATQVLSRLRGAFGVELPLDTLFDAPTVAGLAMALEARGTLEIGILSPDRPRLLPRGEGVNEFPLSFSQQRLWFLDRLQPGAPAYNLLQVLRLTGPLDPVAFDHALSLVVARHESLRTRFGERNGNPFQAVEPPRPVAARWVDLRALPEGEREGEALRQAAAEARSAFDLEAGGLLRATLWALGEDRHLLSLTVHHIVSDGWSFGVLLADVVAFYAALVAGRPPVLAPLAVQYPDFAVWQRGWLEGPGLESHLAWWKAHLGGAPPLLELPTDHPRPALQGSRGLRLPVRLAPGIPEDLAALARQENVTVFMLLMAAFDVLLARHSGQGDVVVGTPVANRRLVETEGLIGFFVNTLALRANLSDDPPFQELARRVRETTLGAFAHQDLPFERLVDALRLERHLSYSPLFQALFNLQNAQQPRIELPGLVLEPVDTDPGASAFDLTFSLVEVDGGITGWVECNPDLFERSTLERLAEQYQVLLRGIVADPSRRVSELPLLTEVERRQLTDDWNATVRPRVPGELMHDLVSAQAARTPRSVAVSQAGWSLTYQEMEERSNRLARRLRSLGVGPEVGVGLCVRRTPEMIVALLGILKAGGAYVPLDPSHPAERLGLVIEDSAIPVLVSEEILLESLPAHGATVLCLDRDADAIAAESGEPLANVATEDNLAYVLYTSGSTGRPKGVQLPHRAVVNFLRAMAERPGLDEGGVIPALTTLSFDIAGLEIYLPLMVGSRVEVLEREEVADGVVLARRLTESGATLVQATPAGWRMLLDAGWEGIPGLRAVSGGEALPRDLAEALMARGAELWNGYGPTETAVYSAAWKVLSGTGPVLLGTPVANTRIHVVDRALGLAPTGVAGELLIGGMGVARGYLGRPDLTAEKFIPNPFTSEAGARLYRTGDLVRWRSNGELEFLGRIDHQVKVRGFRIELGEIEAALLRHPQVGSAVVVARGEGGEKQLIAYLVPEGEKPSQNALREHLRRLLPDYMLPAVFVPMEAFPLTPSGKVDRKALPAPEGTRDAASEHVFVDPTTDLERTIAAIWREALKIDRVGADDNFFDLGGHSMLASQVHIRLSKALGREVALVDLFQYPTVSSLAAYLGGEANAASRIALERATRRRTAGRLDDAVAIIGMAGRFPGAKSVEAFWRNLTEGVESISFFSDKELREAGVPEAALTDPSYVRARGVVEGADEFDAAFFGFNPREAGMIDPQQRIFLECAWEVFEEAGHDPATFPGDVGVFAGSGMNTYIFNFLTRPEIIDPVDSFQLMISNDKDFLSSRVSYKLGLKGPSVAVQSACSTSLVAVHFACQSILSGECDAALAGGISLRLPQATGYRHQEGSVFSSDGHCRAFDEAADGLVASNGVGIVLLRRLSDALRDGDPIRAVIRGSAMNNDGAVRAGYTAPGVDGQSQVVAQALAVAGVEPESIGYLEAHGTGTNLGDPIEMAALIQAFGPQVARGSRWIGSGKTNVGHLDTAAGVTGLIKTALVVERGWIPATLNFQKPNPKLRLEESPFRVVDRLTEWPSGDAPRRAGVSSLGIGGTNAHVIVEEPPPAEPGSASRSWQLLLLSARTPVALEAAIDRFAAFLRGNPETDFADAAYTLQVGRRSFGNRLALVCRDGEDALSVLEGAEKRRLLWSEQETADRPVTFLFSGLGEHYPGMARELYATEPTFRAQLDRCCDLLAQHLDLDLRTLLFPEAPETASTGTDLRALLGRRERKASELDRTLYAQPAVFAVEYALAHLLLEWGIRPQSLIGYSLGEYTAACIAGVLSLEDALALVARRARLIDGLPSGAMLAVPLPEEETRELLGEELSVASLNGPSATVVSGPEAAIADLERRLEERGQPGRRLPTTHAFHSRMMEPIRGAFAAMVSDVRLSPPRIPYLSNVTGTWITAEEATDSGYWVRHLCQAVRFADGLAELSQDSTRVLVEVGPGQGLTALALQAPGELTAIPTVRSSWDVQPDTAFLLTALGKLWLAGVPVDWTGFYAHEQRRRVALPTYPFQRQSYWVKGTLELGKGVVAQSSLEKRPDPADWLYAPSWRRSVVSPQATGTVSGPALVMGSGGIAEGLLTLLRGREVEALEPEAVFRPGSREDHLALFRRLAAEDRLPRTIFHLWSLEDDGSFEDAQERGFRSLIALAQAWGEVGGGQPLELLVVTSGLFEIGAGEDLRPERATLLGPARVIPWEYPGVSCRVVDVASGFKESSLLSEMGQPDSADRQVALRRSHRWVQTWGPVRLDTPAAGLPRIREDGVYLVTGGTGGIGLELAAALAEGRRVRLALLARTITGAEASMARKLRRIQELEASGAEVMTVAADVTDRASLAAAVAQVRERFGPIQGVVHAAGLPGGGVLQLHSSAGIEAVMAPAIQGVRLLDELLAGDPLDFFVLTSGASGLSGGPGQTHFSAAGAFLDAWAQGQSLKPGAPFTVTLDWDTWREVGMVADLSGLPEDVRWMREQALATGIAPAEGRQVFQRVLERGSWPQVVVSTKDLAAVQAHLETLAREGAGSGGGAPRAAYARPDLRSGYVAPRNESEETVARIWEELLGLDRVGVEDNFFDLGGHSLLATQVLSRLRGAFGIDLPLDALFEAPTVAGISASLETHRAPAAAAEADDLEALLREIEELSADEAASTYQEELNKYAHEPG